MSSGSGGERRRFKTIVAASGSALAVVETVRDVVDELPRHSEAVKSLAFFAALKLVTTMAPVLQEPPDPVQRWSGSRLTPG